jgi:rhamnogalacturonyl hydrolase YesR
VNKFFAFLLFLVMAGCSMPMLPLKRPAEVLSSIKDLSPSISERLNDQGDRLSRYQMAIGMGLMMTIFTQEQAKVFAEQSAIAAFYNYEAYVLAVHGELEEAKERADYADAILEDLKARLQKELDAYEEKQNQKMSF